MLVKLGDISFLRFTTRTDGVRLEPVTNIRNISVRRVFKDPSVIPTEAQKANPDNWISGAVVVTCGSSVMPGTATNGPTVDYEITETLEDLDKATGYTSTASAAKKTA
jgi:hypothetical protein